MSDPRRASPGRFRARINYYRRVIDAYVLKPTSHLSFWHGTPRVNDNASIDSLGEYYMPFLEKADYDGQFDDHGVPMLDYRGSVGLQYNPIAIAQYGLGNFNCYSRTEDGQRLAKFIGVADWLVDNLEQNQAGIWVWNHHFDWEYRDTLRAPWYSGLAQGQGVSVLVRAQAQTGDDKYMNAAKRAFASFEASVEDGGVTDIDGDGAWFEETIVDPLTHILNGHIWAMWGVWDYYLATRDEAPRALFEESVRALKAKLELFDAGYWSLYEQSGTLMKMLASPFYHQLHIVQLAALHRLTGDAEFSDYSARWQRFFDSTWKRRRAFAYKAVFKLLYY